MFLAIDQIAQPGLSSCLVIYYLVRLFSLNHALFRDTLFVITTILQPPKSSSTGGTQVISGISGLCSGRFYLPHGHR
ncbi:hypothetical protein EHW66_16530 [Erwinia psidii]|uniref:Uncharacterized protein n=1 Tax=Erwinia psidii TaxID=69224 RepID=A0A3N6RXD1_9GAMM|nr:hypothetical protein [Erwinia psidii]MCX8961900.1 hypothetical protein [Erwinia psidii]MCX8966523.1 hypothetical protein [Erwinia psidii]RQM37758.1 hypothetical protein EB241_12900 [Erwinia psidii]